MVNPRAARILVVDAEETMRGLLSARLAREGHEVLVAGEADECERVFKEKENIAVLVIDLNMPGRDGMSLLEKLKKKHPYLRVIVISGQGDKQSAIQALRRGVSNYLEKPFDLDELVRAVSHCLRERQTEHEKEELMDRLEGRAKRIEGKDENKYWYVSKAAAMAKVNEWLNFLRREAMRGLAEEPSVLILGESGTGKEGIARMVHAGSGRGQGPWIAVNCANFNEQLLESELFGHERAAFIGAGPKKRGLFELAKGGTLFLDEIGEMDLDLQGKILRALQEKVFRRVGGSVDIESDVRVVAAANPGLNRRVAEGKFREELYQRLSRVMVEVPSLRERAEDIVPMSRQFAENTFRSRGKVFCGFLPEAESALRSYEWTGNMRELLHVIERASLLWDGIGPMPANMLFLPAPQSGLSSGPPKLQLFQSPFGNAESQDFESFMKLKRKWVDTFEKEYLISVVERNGGNISSAAREAKMDRSNFLRLLRRHSMSPRDFRMKKAA